MSRIASVKILIISAYYLKFLPCTPQNLLSSKFEELLSLNFLVDFGAWRSPPSADFARAISAESAENSGFRAGSDYSLLPMQFKE